MTQSPDLLSTLGKRILALRVDRAMSMRDLAKEIGVSAMAVSKWEAGTAAPDSRHLLSLGKIFSVSLDWLMMGYSNDREALALCIAVALREGEITRGRAWELCRIVGVPFPGEPTEPTR